MLGIEDILLIRCEFCKRYIDGEQTIDCKLCNGGTFHKTCYYLHPCVNRDITRST